MLLVFGAFAAWSGSRLSAAYQEIEAARAEASALVSVATTFETEGLRAKFDSVAEHIDAARAISNEPAWTIASWIPWAGKNLVVAKELIEVASETIELAHPLVAWADGFKLSDLAPKDGMLPLQMIEDGLGLMQEFSAGLPPLVERAQAIDTAGTIGQIRSGADEVVAAFTTASSALADVEGFAGVLPSMLGKDGPRTYVIAFLNGAELRSLGGAALAFAQVTIDQGQISLGGTIQAGNGGFRWVPESPIVPVPDGFEYLFPGTYGRFIVHATVRPSFVSAGEQIAANFAVWRGTQVDDVVGMDATALQSILAASGAHICAR